VNPTASADLTPSPRGRAGRPEQGGLQGGAGIVPTPHSALGTPGVKFLPVRRRPSLGQSLVEFAIVLPILLLLVGGIIQFGILFWTQNTMTQIARDTGRWAATQVSACNTGATPVQTHANALASSTSLLAYPANPVPVTVAWALDAGSVGTDPCPPTNNQTVWWVTITVRHDVPSFIPFLNFAIPGCNGTTCALSSSAQYRMEPAPQ
jgi:TadE-like protein